MSDWSPASETLTDTVYGGSPVYRQHWSGASATNGTVLQTGVTNLVRAGGWGNSSSSYIRLVGFGDTTNGIWVYLNASNELVLAVFGVLVGQPYSFWVEYCK